MSQRLHILQHVPFEGPGTIETWATSHNLQITKTLFSNRTWSLPQSTDFDLLVIMGGPMGPYDENQCPWLKEEKKLIEQAINANKKIFGVCLGAQLIASVLGARVYKNQHKEIGWFNVEKAPESKILPFMSRLPDSFCAFHWHNDTFELPIGAVRLFHSSGCKQQGFIIGSNILGLQFHLEVTASNVLELLENASGDLASLGPYVQTAAEIKNNISQAEQLQTLLLELMDNLYIGQTTQTCGVT